MGTYPNNEMYVIKRNGRQEIVAFDKILNRVKSLGKEHNININYTNLVIKVIDQLHDDIQTSKIDELTAEQAASMSTIHPDYGILAGALVISNLHKKTTMSFSQSMNKIFNFYGTDSSDISYLSKEYIYIVNEYAAYFDNLINHRLDFLIDYFGFKTLERAYLIHTKDVIIERPQYMWLRVAICIHGKNLDAVKETYDLMSQKYFTHATPTLFNAGTSRPQLSSCFLIAMESDSVDGIYNTIKECANISKWAGGIGLHIHNIRSKGSHIRGTNGTSNGIVPMLRVFEKTAKYIDQGGGKRTGSFAIYIEPHHADIEDFLDLKKNHGEEELRARDLFYALWVSDLFMERVKTNEIWSLFCPARVKGLSDCYGDDYKKLYEQYEKEKKYVRQINARDIWIKILDSQMETGTPYILYKDTANKKSNQKNLGTIKSSNLCAEIIEYTNENETAVCNLASIALNKFVVETKSPFADVVVYSKDKCNWCILMKALLKRKGIDFKEIKLVTDKEIAEFKEKHRVETIPQLLDNSKLIGGFNTVQEILRNNYDYERLHAVAKVVTNNLNRVIDINYYPTEKTRRSNLYHRPIGIGVQGLADTFMLMDLPFDSNQAKEINKNIFETIYHAALEQSLYISSQRADDLAFLKDVYLSNWSFLTDHDLCQKYVVEDYVSASSSTTIENDYKVTKLLEKYKPIRREIVRNIDNKKHGSYSSFEGSPASQGILQFDMWGVIPSNRYDWDNLKDTIKKFGIRNSLLVAPMPTASTSQIMGNNECFEPITNNIYTRRTLAGEFVLANKYLIRELIELNIWNDEIKNNIILNKGSIQYIENIPKFIKDKYKIVWEISMKILIDMARDRGAFICQSQSLNLWLEDPTPKLLTNMHFYSWNAGLKTGIYYLRRKPRHQPQQFTIEPIKKEEDYDEKQKDWDDDTCTMCSG